MTCIKKNMFKESSSSWKQPKSISLLFSWTVNPPVVDKQTVWLDTAVIECWIWSLSADFGSEWGIAVIPYLSHFETILTMLKINKNILNFTKRRHARPSWKVKINCPPEIQTSVLQVCIKEIRDRTNSALVHSTTWTPSFLFFVIFFFRLLVLSHPYPSKLLVSLVFSLSWPDTWC